MNQTLNAPDFVDYTPLDGYAWLEQQARSIHGPLHAMPEAGDWPYVCYARGARGDNFIIKEFCEHDVKTWIFTDRDAYTAALSSLKNEDI